jgi:hypothetical protein
LRGDDGLRCDGLRCGVCNMAANGTRGLGRFCCAIPNWKPAVLNNALQRAAGVSVRRKSLRKNLVTDAGIWG